jgi:hypothetical protein
MSATENRRSQENKQAKVFLAPPSPKCLIPMELSSSIGLVLRAYWSQAIIRADSQMQREKRQRMFAAMLFAISIVALSQFAAYYWRAMLTGAAAQPVSERILLAAGARDGQLSGEDFPALVGLHNVTPELRSGSSGL